MLAKRVVISLTSDGSGNCTAYSDVVSGTVQEVRYVNTSFTGTPAFTVTSEAAGQTIWAETVATTSLSRAPRQATHLNTSGAAALYAAGGTAVLEPIAVGTDRIKVVVSGAGATKVAALHVFLV